MESHLERISAVECRVRVQIPWEVISPRFASKLRELQSKARIPGFRPGKVPPQMIEQMFGKSVRDELAREFVDETFQDAVTKHAKVPLTQPVLEEGVLNKGEPFRYAARFEVPPEIAAKDYVGVPVRRRPAAADEAKVESLLKDKREELSELRPIPEGTQRETQAGDVWTLDLDGTLGNVKIGRKDLQVTIGEDANEYIPGLAAALAGTTLDAVGQTRTITFRPVQERIKPELRGVDAVLMVGFRDVREKHLPALDDDFARDANEDVDSFEALKEKYRARLLEEDKNEAERDARRRLVEELLRRNTFEVAPSLVAREVAAQVDVFKQQVQQQGLTLQRLGLTEAQVAGQYRPQALFNVKAFLLLDAIGKAEAIVVAEDEVEAELKQMAEERKQNVDRMRATMEKNNQLLLLRAQLREEKILDFLMSKAEVTEAPDPAPAAGESSGETAAT